MHPVDPSGERVGGWGMRLNKAGHLERLVCYLVGVRYGVKGTKSEGEGGTFRQTCNGEPKLT